MGNFGETPIMLQEPKTQEQVINDKISIIATAGDIAERSINIKFDAAARLAKSEQVQQFIKDNNLEPYIKDLTVERVKTFMIMLGFIPLFKAIKSPIGIATIVGAGIYIASMAGNKEAVVQKAADKIADNTIKNIPGTQQNS
jgi:hypothetical protein